MIWQDSPWRIVAFASILSITEFARAHLFTGLPWNAPGQALLNWPVLFQSAAIWGAHMLDFIVLLCAALPAAIWPRYRDAMRVRRKPRLMVTIVIAIVAAANIWIGLDRLTDSNKVSEDGTNLRIVLVQPSIPQSDKWKPEFQQQNFDRLISLSRQAADKLPTDGTRIFIWPESALPFGALLSESWLNKIDDMLHEREYLMVGLLRADPGNSRRILNSAVLLDETAGFLGAYDKHRLVPFGEYMPFLNFLDAYGFSTFTNNQSLSQGKSQVTVFPDNIAPFAVMICYEAIFPFLPNKSNRPKASWIINLTNDAWFGPWAGPQQHFNQVKLRAVESGLPIARVSNNGISAWIDPFGRIRGELATNVQGGQQIRYTAPLANTIYSIIGDTVFLSIAVISLLFGTTYAYRYT